MTAIIVWFQAQLIEARARAAEEAERGEIVEKVIIVAAAAAIAIAAMAAIAAAVDHQDRRSRALTGMRGARHRNGCGLDPPRDERARPTARTGYGSARDRGSSTVEFVIASGQRCCCCSWLCRLASVPHPRRRPDRRHGLDHVRTINGSPGEGIDVASEFLDQSGGGLENRNVDATRTAAVSSVTVSGRVVSILPGVSFTVSVTVDAPTERIEP
jgi:hypothetical protein